MVTAARVLRTKLGIRIVDLAKETGIPERALYRFERGQEWLSPKYREAYCRALRVKPEEIFMPAPFENWPKPVEGVPKWVAKDLTN